MSCIGGTKSILIEKAQPFSVIVFQTCLLQTRRSTCLLFFCCRGCNEGLHRGDEPPRRKTPIHACTISDDRLLGQPGDNDEPPDRHRGRPYEPPTVRPGWRRWLSLKPGVLNIIFAVLPKIKVSRIPGKTLEWGVGSLAGEGSRSRQSVVHFSSIVSVRPRSLDCTKKPSEQDTSGLSTRAAATVQCQGRCHAGQRLLGVLHHPTYLGSASRAASGSSSSFLHFSSANFMADRWLCM